MGYSDQNADEPLGTKIGGLIAAAVGFGFARYVGAASLIPLAIGVASFFAIRKFAPSRASVCGILATTLAQLGWFILAVVAVPGGFAQLALDIGVTTILLGWLAYKPGIAPALALIAFELLGLVVNLNIALAAGLGSEPFKALLVHITLRLLIIGFGSAFLLELYRERRLQTLLVEPDAPNQA